MIRAVMLEEALAWEHPEDVQCLYGPLWGVPARCVLSYAFCFLPIVCSGFCTGSAQNIKKSSLGHLGTL